MATTPQEIWIGDGVNGFRIKICAGPAGLGLRISSFAGTPSLSVFHHHEEGDGHVYDGEAECVQLTQHTDQTFHEWFIREAGQPSLGELPIDATGCIIKSS